MADFYPKRLAELPPWHANFNLQVQATGTTYGMSAAQKAQVLEDSINVPVIVNYAELVEGWAQAVTEHREIMLRGDLTAPLPTFPTPPLAIVLSTLTPLPGIEARTRLYAGIIRSDSDFTAAIGELYGITGIAAGSPATPSVEAFALTASQVRLAIARAGYAVVAVDSRINNGAWVQIGISMTAEYFDTRAPLVAGAPEVREYRVQGMENNARVGATSAVAKAVTVP